MYIYQYMLISTFIFLFFNKDLRLASVSFLFGWVVYFFIVISFGAGSYYALSAAIELFIGCSLINRYKLVSYLSFLLIFVNFYGICMHEIGVGPKSYDFAYCLISIFQVLTLIARGMVGGNTKLCNKRPLVFLADFDSRKNHAKIQKTT